MTDHYHAGDKRTCEAIRFDLMTKIRRLGKAGDDLAGQIGLPEELKKAWRQAKKS